MRVLALPAGLALFAALLSLPAAPLRAAESFDACAGFIDAVPATVTAPGIWCLRRDLSTAVTRGNAITVAANNVTIDCNGFRLGGLAAGGASQAHGIRADDRQNAVVRHCNVRGFHVGIFLSGGAGHLVEDNRLDNNLFAGIYALSEQTRVRRNAVHDTGGSPGMFVTYGIFARADVLDNTVDGVVADGVDTYPRGIEAIAAGGVVRGNQVRNVMARGAGSAFGVIGGGLASRIVDNHVANAAVTAGIGIYGTGSASFCAGNSVYGFGSAYASCEYAAGNLPAP